MSDKHLESVGLVRKLPDIYRRRDGLPDGLRGARIVDIGTPRDPSLVEGGGLVIDYCPEGSKTTRRVVLAFNELGMWVEEYFAGRGI